jgi:Lar family restriction alleviation protein
MNENKQLNPCPFCGNSDLLRMVKFPKISADLKDFTMLESHVDCVKCGANGPTRVFVNDPKKSWNERKEGK